MTERFYLDTSIWMDIYEDRKGYNGELLGEFGWKLLTLLKSKKHKLIITDLLIKELEINYSIEKINGMMILFDDVIERIKTTISQRDEAEKIARERNLPRADILHAILARDNRLILITRDNHFKRLNEISEHHKPEEFI